MKKRGAPKKSNDVKRTAEIKISMTQDMKDMISWFAKNIDGKPTPPATFLYDLLVSFIEKKKFTLNAPLQATVEMRQEFKNVANNLNQLTRIYNHKCEYLRDSNEDADRVFAEVKSTIIAVKEMHRATMHHRVEVLDLEFWNKVKERMDK